MIEPAAYGAAVSFGPNTWNFRDIVAALTGRRCGSRRPRRPTTRGLCRPLPHRSAFTLPLPAPALGNSSRASSARQAARCLPRQRSCCRQIGGSAPSASRRLTSSSSRSRRATCAHRHAHVRANVPGNSNCRRHTSSSTETAYAAHRRS